MVSTINRRIFTRLPLDFKVEYFHKGDYIISFSKDVSLDGMFLCTDSPLPAGTKISLIFPAEDSYDVEIPALVVWVNGNGQQGSSGMGVQFLATVPKFLKEKIIKAAGHIETIRLDENQA